MIGKRGKDIRWDNEWLIDNYWSATSVQELCDRYNETFGTAIGRTVLNHQCIKIGLTKSYTKEQMDWLRENYPALGAEEGTARFNERFRQSRKPHAIQSVCKNNGIKVSSKTRSEIGRKNNAKKKDYKEYKIGDTRKHHGYTYIKVSDDRQRKNWELLHHYLYKKHYGSIPKGHIVIFLDNNKDNVTIENLVAIPWKYNGLLNGNCLKSENAEITKTAIQWCELKNLMDLQEGKHEFMGN